MPGEDIMYLATLVHIKSSGGKIYSVSAEMINTSGVLQ